MIPRTPPIPNAVPRLAGNEWRYLKECLDTNWVSSAGPFIERFEREVARYVGAPHAVATVNGTAALHVALRVAGVEPGDEVLVPSLTFIATANAVAYCGAHPVFLDSEEASWGVDPQKVADFLARECLTRAGRTVNRATGRVVRALLPVHLYGHPCDLDPLLEVAGRYPLAIVEDAAEALGARYRGRRVGGDGRLACLSFNGNKIITTGGGGMVLTGDAALAGRLRTLTTQARTDPIEYIHEELGFNYRLTNIQAALGVAQLEQLDGFIESKRATAAFYREALGAIDGVRPFVEAPWARSSYWMAAALLPQRRCPDVRALLRELSAAGIGARPLWRPLHLQPLFAGAQAYRVDVATRLYDRGLSLPCSVGITPEERVTVVEALRSRLSP
ncbi:MAG: LegC family aminotransferase [Candidatus Rokubacteria bacterium]|nr:LegC family aminotransferase [Candidatus Rokubacteria bacterium]MBI3105851.1 LegC family aminotransferase [Candidatus Rokubacteria bacterium]